MTECCDDYGQCRQGPGCPVRETPAGMHTRNGGSAHIDTRLPIAFVGPEPSWWQRLVRIIFGA